MAEYVIDEDEYRAAMSKAYEAGAAGREVYTARDYLTRELVRCKDCKHYRCGMCRMLVWRKSEFPPSVNIGDRYCAWGERREELCR